MPPSRTIARPASLNGVGLHTGESATLTFRPATGPGIVFRRTDLYGMPLVRAIVENVSETERRTELTEHGVSVSTVEHVLAATAGVGVDDVTVDLSGPEPPAMDGSADSFARALLDAGVIETTRSARTFVVTDPFSLGESYTVRPAPGLTFTTSIEWDHPLIGRQELSVQMSPESFLKEISKARTFGFLNEVKQLRDAGLIKGAGEENAVVLSEDGLVGSALRWDDEFVRHKMLDLLGDITLLGGRLQGEIVAHRPSHKGNVSVTAKIKEEATCKL